MILGAVGANKALGNTSFLVHDKGALVPTTSLLGIRPLGATEVPKGGFATLVTTSGAVSYFTDDSVIDPGYPMSFNDGTQLLELSDCSKDGASLSVLTSSVTGGIGTIKFS